MDRRWCTSHRLLLGRTFNREERKSRKRKRRSETFTDTQDRCMLGCRDMLAGHLKLELTDVL